MTILKSFVEALEKTQWISAEELFSYQRKPLEKILRHAHETVPFYRDRLDILFTGNGSIDWDKWTEIPFIDRSEIQGREADLLSGDIPESHGELDTAISSGSTGRPISIVKTAMTHLAYYAVRAH